MILEETSQPLEAKPPSVRMPVPDSFRGKVFYAAFISVMPIVAFWATELFKPDWQDGKLSSYVILLLTPAAAWIFFPLLLFSIVCYLLLLMDLPTYARHFVVRLGIYTGTILALQYSVLIGLFLVQSLASFFLLFLLWAAPLFAGRLFSWAKARWGARIVVSALGILLLFSFVLSIVLQSTIYAPLIILLVGLTAAAPFWALLLAYRAAAWLLRNAESKRTFAHGLSLTAWLGVYAVAWRYDILQAIQAYSSLPTHPPDCYIATAAARGHPRFVGARMVQRLAVNPQLQTLKCAELALMAISPRVHRILRRFYDVVGRFLARRIQNPYLADVAYLLLKPCEWLAVACLRVVLPEIDRLASRIYVDRS